MSAEEQELPHTTADWTLELNCDCPHCKEYVNLLDFGDFWDQQSGLEACEHGTERTKKLEVHCPSCRQDFTVECQY